MCQDPTPDKEASLESNFRPGFDRDLKCTSTVDALRNIITNWQDIEGECIIMSIKPLALIC